MADEIRPTLPITPGPLVSPPPEDRRRERQKSPRQETGDEQEHESRQQDKDTGGHFDEYV